MGKFRKRPVVIEAVQFNKLGDHPAVVEFPGSATGFGIHTLEHTQIKHEVTPGDWIITGVQGEVYACKPDIFEHTYEPVNEPTAEALGAFDEFNKSIERLMNTEDNIFSDVFKSFRRFNKGIK
jgi:hypothetical protein